MILVEGGQGTNNVMEDIAGKAGALQSLLSWE